MTMSSSTHSILRAAAVIVRRRGHHDAHFTRPKDYLLTGSEELVLRVGTGPRKVTMSADAGAKIVVESVGFREAKPGYYTARNRTAAIWDFISRADQV